MTLVFVEDELPHLWVHYEANYGTPARDEHNKMCWCMQPLDTWNKSLYYSFGVWYGYWSKKPLPRASIPSSPDP